MPYIRFTLFWFPLLLGLVLVGRDADASRRLDAWPGGTDLVDIQTGTRFVGPATEVFLYYADGNLSRDHAVEICYGWLRTTTDASGSAVWAIEWWNHTQAQTAPPSLHWRPSLSLATISTAWSRLSQDARWDYTWDAENRLLSRTERSGPALTAAQNTLGILWGNPNVTRASSPSLSPAMQRWGNSPEMSRRSSRSVLPIP